MIDTDTSLQNPTEKVIFKPTGAMQKWLDKAVELMSVNKSEISKACGVDRSTWYDWLDVPGFLDWYTAEYKRRRQVILPELDAIGMKQARRGDFNFWKEMNRKAGDSGEDGGTKVQINNIISTKKEEYGL